MLTVYVRTSDHRLEVGRGEIRAQFELQDGLWVPTWMYQGDRRMLRFKDHQWFVLGHVRPRATDWEIVEDTANKVLVRFCGEDSYFGVPVEWCVSVGVEDRWPGLTISTEIIPAQTIELVECFTHLETPPEYDGSEEMLCMIGQNPIAHWRGKELLTPRCPTPLPSRIAFERMTCPSGPTRSPICCLRLGANGERPEQYITILGDWSICSFRSLCVSAGDCADGLRSYQLSAGVLDWCCGVMAEPNVFFEGGQRHRQRFSVSFSSQMPGGSLDRWFFGAFERSLRLHFPENGPAATVKNANSKKATLAAANDWLIQMIGGDGVPGLYSPDRGLVNYTEGGSPNAGRYSMAALTPWLGALGYQAFVTRRDELSETCGRLIARVTASADHPQKRQETVGTVYSELLPLLRYLSCYPDDTLQALVRRAIGQMLETFPPNGGTKPDLDYGSEALHAEAYLLAGRLAGDKQLIQAGLSSLDRVNAAADRFWRFGCAVGQEDRAAGGQARPLGYGHAILANLIAHQHTNNNRHLDMAGAFARYLASICFATVNDSPDPDFDTRGFANGAIGGLDSHVACSPIETSDSLRCVAYWLSFQHEAASSFYDLLWLLSRAFCGVFPASRRQRLGLAVDGRSLSRPVSDLPTAIAYQRFPYIAFENPVRQTWQSPRASVEALQNHLTFGGGLASCNNDRLLVLVPRAAGLDLSERISRLVHVYNPMEVPEKASLAVHHLPANREFEVLLDGTRVAKGLASDTLSDIEVEVPPRSVLVVDVTPSRKSNTQF